MSAAMRLPSRIGTITLRSTMAMDCSSFSVAMRAAMACAVGAGWGCAQRSPARKKRAMRSIFESVTEERVRVAVCYPHNLAHLLIVDDDANTLASLARAFRLAGHEATVCDNAARALDLLKSQPFDMMLSDVVMPGKDGLALLEDLRTSGITLPVVMISGRPISKWRSAPRAWARSISWRSRSPPTSCC